MKGDIEQELRGHRCSHSVGGSEMTRGRGVEEQSPMAVASQFSSPHSWTPTTVVCAVCQVAENSGFKHWCTTMELGQGTPQLPDAKNGMNLQSPSPLIVTWSFPHTARNRQASCSPSCTEKEILLQPPSQIGQCFHSSQFQPTWFGQEGRDRGVTLASLGELFGDPGPRITAWAPRAPCGESTGLQSLGLLRAPAVPPTQRSGSLLHGCEWVHEVKVSFPFLSCVTCNALSLQSHETKRTKES